MNDFSYAVAQVDPLASLRIQSRRLRFHMCERPQSVLLAQVTDARRRTGIGTTCRLHIWLEMMMLDNTWYDCIHWSHCESQARWLQCHWSELYGCHRLHHTQAQVLLPDTLVH